mgnify:CR=1 FL=1
MSIEVRNLNKRFGATVVCDNLNLDIAVGRAGRAARARRARARRRCCASSPASRCPTPARCCSTARTPPTPTCASASVGFVFQHYALFGHMTIFENVAFGLRVRPQRDAARRERRSSAKVMRAARAGAAPTGSPTATRTSSPAASASASRSRARSRSSPRCCCSTSPFGALDAQVRKELRRWLRRLHDEMHVTSVFVTHDQEEAMEVADRIVVMNHGRIEQDGPPDEVYDHPATPFVLQFLGDVNLFHGRCSASAARPGRRRSPSCGRTSSPIVADARCRARSPATLAQALTVGPNTRLEFRRSDDQSYVDVEMPRSRVDGAARSPRPRQPGSSGAPAAAQG